VATSIRQDVIQHILDRPHEVVTKEAIMAAGNWTAEQVTAAVLAVQRTSPIGAEIETIVRGNSWRYVPKVPVPTVRSTDVRQAEVADDTKRPLTELIREYLMDHPNVVVSVTSLSEYTGRDPFQVKVGINNFRNSAAHKDVSAYVKTVVGGQLWRYEPPLRQSPRTASRSWQPRRPVTQPQLPLDPAEPVPQTVNGDAVTVTDEDGSVQVFEEVGKTADGRYVIRDEHGNMYTATKI
jgi:hypothetical protein